MVGCCLYVSAFYSPHLDAQWHFQQAVVTSWLAAIEHVFAGYVHSATLAAVSWTDCEVLERPSQCQTL
jgi:hypothetical protein